jgi:hypothetical protein
MFFIPKRNRPTFFALTKLKWKTNTSATAKRMISGLVLKDLNGECFGKQRGYETAHPVSSSFNLTVPAAEFQLINQAQRQYCK